ncbi:MAG: hypothetical protein AAGI36_13205 [Pseudomonadota bacterium]
MPERALVQLALVWGDPRKVEIKDRSNVRDSMIFCTAGRVKIALDINPQIAFTPMTIWMVKK